MFVFKKSHLKRFTFKFPVPLGYDRAAGSFQPNFRDSSVSVTWMCDWLPYFHGLANSGAGRWMWLCGQMPAPIQSSRVRKWCGMKARSSHMEEALADGNSWSLDQGSDISDSGNVRIAGTGIWHLRFRQCKDCWNRDLTPRIQAV